LQNVATIYCVVRGSHKILLRQTLSWDCPFNSGKSKQLNLESKALEDINRAYYNLNKDCFIAFIGQWAILQRTANLLGGVDFEKNFISKL
jgi:hypothetical protein